MKYKTTIGACVEYPHAIAAQLLKVSGDDMLSEYITKTREIYSVLQSLDSMCITLKEENKRLLYENQFMIRLINDRLNGEI